MSRLAGIEVVPVVSGAAVALAGAAVVFAGMATVLSGVAGTTFVVTGASVGVGLPGALAGGGGAGGGDSCARADPGSDRPPTPSETTIVAAVTAVRAWRKNRGRRIRGPSLEAIEGSVRRSRFSRYPQDLSRDLGLDYLAAGVSLGPLPRGRGEPRLGAPHVLDEPIGDLRQSGVDELARGVHEKGEHPRALPVLALDRVVEAGALRGHLH